jgi:Cu(I)/Ag(I) efflux system membrane fusion protein
MTGWDFSVLDRFSRELRRVVETQAGRSTPGALALAAMLALGVVTGLLLHRPITGRVSSDEPPAGASSAPSRKQLWTCGMHPQVIQDQPGLCPICQMKLEPVQVDNPSASGAATMERRIKHWWDPMMGPASISKGPGTSAMGMPLVPVYEGDDSAGSVLTIDPVVIQNMGVRVAEARLGSLNRFVRAVGYLEEAEPNVRDINLRVSGWIERLYADTVGMPLRKGDKLFELYSPEVQLAVAELVAARRSAAIAEPGGASLAETTSRTLLASARQKLELWGIGESEIIRLASGKQAPRTVAFTSPIDGHVTVKSVVQGSAVKAGDMVMRIVDHSFLWLDAQVHAQDFGLIRYGQAVTATVETAPGREFEGEVIFVHPHVDPVTRTATVRMMLPNPEMSLRPGMYANATIKVAAAAQSLLVPREAIIDTGALRVAFVAVGNGRFEPRRVETGISGDDGEIEILKGLAPGENVVTSGQFLMDAESRVREAIQKHLSGGLLTEKEAASGIADAAPNGAELPQKDHLPWTPNVDSLFRAYLHLSDLFGSTTPVTAPVDPSQLVAAARELSKADDAENSKAAQEIADKATTLAGKPVEEQRKIFSGLSDAVIAFAERRPPSKAVADKLYVMSCSMIDGRWLQTTDALANPYYADEMKECGEIKRTIATVAAP